MSLKEEHGVQKWVLVSTTSTPTMIAIEKVVENTKTTKAGEDDRYLGNNLAQVLYI